MTHDDDPQPHPLPLLPPHILECLERGELPENIPADVAKGFQWLIDYMPAQFDAWVGESLYLAITNGIHDEPLMQAPLSLIRAAMREGEALAPACLDAAQQFNRQIAADAGKPAWIVWAHQEWNMKLTQAQAHLN